MSPLVVEATVEVLVVLYDSQQSHSQVKTTSLIENHFVVASLLHQHLLHLVVDLPVSFVIDLVLGL